MKIAIGLGKNENVLKAVKKFPFEIKIAKSNEELLGYLKDPDIDGVIRGSLESDVIGELRKDYPCLFRASLLEVNGHKFFLTPVGIDECDSLNDKKEIITECAKTLEKIDIKPRISILAGGRKQDIGRSQKIDNSIRESEEIYSTFKDKYDIKNDYILIEEAIKEKSNIIIAPDGITGNIIFRSLVLVAKVKSYGAITLNQPYTLIDTSRSQSVEGYVNAIKLMTKIIDGNK